MIDRDWEHYDFHHVVYRPLGMTTDQLIDGYVKLYRDVSSVMRIIAKGIGIVGTVGLAAAFPPVMWNILNQLDARRKKKSLCRCRDRLEIRLCEI